MSEEKYPCTDCEEEKKCGNLKKYRKCKPFLKWFHEQWVNIRKLFGVECVESTHEETK
jgi:hypothetical protein